MYFHRHLIYTLFIFGAMHYYIAEAGDIKGTITLSGKKSNANAIIYIDKITGKKFRPPSKPEKMDQKNLANDFVIL